MCYFVLPVILLVIRRAGEKEWLSFLTSRTMESKSKESFTVSELKGPNSFKKKKRYTQVIITCQNSPT
jgi:mannitol-specific phosphotransferase system IIBC component